jgi:hypothetical protein
MRKTTFAGLVALAGLWLVAALLSGQRLPSHTATASVPALGLTVTAELFALSDLTEFERRLTLSAADGATLRVRMADLRGPAGRMGLYRVGDGTEVAVLAPDDGGPDEADGGNGGFFAVGPLRRLDGPSRPSADWTCLGAFELAMVPNGANPARGRAQVFAFVPAAEGSAAIASPESAAHAALRAGGAGRSCPLPASVEGGGGRAPPAYRARAMQNSTMPASADRSRPGGKSASAESASSP